MRIALLYPPPWKIPSAAGEPIPAGEGPPAGFREADLDGDFLQMPYGVLSLASQALAEGHRVEVLNLAALPWTEVESALGRLRADIYGLSCNTANRRGVAATAEAIRRHHPKAQVVVGGPHASALPVEMLEHHPAIDAVVVGEGEATFRELCERLADGRSWAGLPGAVVRVRRGIEPGPPRPRLADLDQLVPPQRYFATHLLLTARGCPGRCTFCAKGAVWGHLYRVHSVDRVLDTIEEALDRLPVRMMLVKDDTFTADRQRGLAICEGIRRRGLRFLWSCDTRADALDDELLRAMRLAGCQRLSIGVESGSRQVLEQIQKNVTPEEILASTEAAKRYGLQVRYYMMLGNRGETAATFRESLDLVARAAPHQALFACLSVYPGTQDFRDLEAAGALDREEYFADDFLELKTPYDASAEDTALMSDWFGRHPGIRELHVETVQESRAILERLGDHHAAHLDLAAAHFRAGELELAERHACRALELGFPAPGLVHNLLACVAAARGDLAGTERALQAGQVDPQHPVLAHNVAELGRWRDQGGPAAGEPPTLVARHDFQLLERTVQPMLPGPLPVDLGRWS